MSFVFQRSTSGSFIRSDGSARNKYGPDVMIGFSVLRRVGVGRVVGSATDYALTVTGPIARMRSADTAPELRSPITAGLISNTVVDPLYTHVIISITWGDGSTTTRTVDYDIDYADMVEVTTNSWGATITNTNVYGVFNPLGFGDGDVSPNGGAVGIYSVNVTATVGGVSTQQGYSQTISTDGLSGSETWSPITDDGGTTYVGCTRTITISQSKSFSDFAGVLSTLLGGITLDDPYTSFNSTEYATIRNGFLRNIYQLGAINTTPGPGELPANNICVGKNRTSGSVYAIPHWIAQSISSVGNSIQGNMPAYWSNGRTSTLLLGPRTGFGYISPYTGLPIFSFLQPICANCVPIENTSSDTAATEIPDTPLLAPYVFSSKSSINVKIDMTSTMYSREYYPSTNSWGTGLATLPSSLGQQHFGPSDLSSVFGYFVATYR